MVALLLELTHLWQDVVRKNEMETSDCFDVVKAALGVGCMRKRNGNFYLLSWHPRKVTGG